MPDMMYGEKERKIIMKEKKDVVLEPQASAASALRDNTKSKRLFGERAGHRK